MSQYALYSHHHSAYAEIHPVGKRIPSGMHYNGNHWLNQTWPYKKMYEWWQPGTPNYTRLQALWVKPQPDGTIKKINKDVVFYTYDVDENIYVKQVVPQLTYSSTPVQLFDDKLTADELAKFAYGINDVATLGLEIVSVRN